MAILNIGTPTPADENILNGRLDSFIIRQDWHMAKAKNRWNISRENADAFDQIMIKTSIEGITDTSNPIFVNDYGPAIERFIEKVIDDTPNYNTVDGQAFILGPRRYIYGEDNLNIATCIEYLVHLSLASIKKFQEDDDNRRTVADISQTQKDSVLRVWNLLPLEGDARALFLTTGRGAARQPRKWIIAELINQGKIDEIPQQWRHLADEIANQEAQSSGMLANSNTLFLPGALQTIINRFGEDRTNRLIDMALEGGQGRLLLLSFMPDYITLRNTYRVIKQQVNPLKLPCTKMTEHKLLITLLSGALQRDDPQPVRSLEAFAFNDDPVRNGATMIRWINDKGASFGLQFKLGSMIFRSLCGNEGIPNYCKHPVHDSRFITAIPENQVFLDSRDGILKVKKNLVRQTHKERKDSKLNEVRGTNAGYITGGNIPESVRTTDPDRIRLDTAGAIASSNVRNVLGMQIPTRLDYSNISGAASLDLGNNQQNLRIPPITTREQKTGISAKQQPINVLNTSEKSKSNKEEKPGPSGISTAKPNRISTDYNSNMLSNIRDAIGEIEYQKIIDRIPKEKIIETEDIGEYYQSSSSTDESEVDEDDDGLAKDYSKLYQQEDDNIQNIIDVSKDISIHAENEQENLQTKSSNSNVLNITPLKQAPQTINKDRLSDIQEEDDINIQHPNKPEENTAVVTIETQQNVPTSSENKETANQQQQQQQQPQPSDQQNKEPEIENQDNIKLAIASGPILTPTHSSRKKKTKITSTRTYKDGDLILNNHQAKTIRSLIGPDPVVYSDLPGYKIALDVNSLDGLIFSLQTLTASDSVTTLMYVSESLALNETKDVDIMSEEITIKASNYDHKNAHLLVTLALFAKFQRATEVINLVMNKWRDFIPEKLLGSLIKLELWGYSHKSADNMITKYFT